MADTDPKTALAEFVAELHNDYEIWYAKAVRSTLRWNIGLQVVAVLSSFGAAALAALANPSNVFWIKPTLVLLPMIGGLATTILTQAKVYDMWKLRENGRIEFQGLVQEGKQKLAAVSDRAEIIKIHEDLQKRAQAVEIVQAGGFFGFFNAETVLKFQGADDASRSKVSKKSPSENLEH